MLIYGIDMCFLIELECEAVQLGFVCACLFILFCAIAKNILRGFPGGSVVKNPPANAGDTGDASSISVLGRPSEEGNGKPLDYSCLGDPMDGGAWWALGHEVTKSRT